MKPGLVFRSSQLVRKAQLAACTSCSSAAISRASCPGVCRAEELQDLGLRSCLDLRESKRKCTKVEKSDLRSEPPSEGMSQVCWAAVHQSCACQLLA